MEQIAKEEVKQAAARAGKTVGSFLMDALKMAIGIGGGLLLAGWVTSKAQNQQGGQPGNANAARGR